MEVELQTGASREARLRFSLRQLFVVSTLGISCFYAGWIAKGKLEPQVYISTEESIPAIRGGGGGHRVARVRVPNASRFAPGDKVGLIFEHSDQPEATSYASCGLIVWATDSTSVSLLVTEDTQEYLLDCLKQPNCRLAKCPTSDTE